jgi:hypothetical protein
MTMKLAIEHFSKQYRRDFLSLCDFDLTRRHLRAKPKPALDSPEPAVLRLPTSVERSGLGSKDAAVIEVESTPAVQLSAPPFRGPVPG